MKKSYLIFIGTVIFLFTLSCAAPFNITVNIGTAGTNTPPPPAATALVKSEPSATPQVNSKKTAEAAIVLTEFAEKSTAQVEDSNAASEECIQDVPIRGDSNYDTVICEDFIDNSNNWRTGLDDDDYYGSTTYSIEDSRYSWDVSSKHGVFRWECMNNVPVVDNFEASIQVQKLHGPTSDACYALVFRAEKAGTDRWNYYAYFVCDDNQFFVARQSNDVWTTLSYKKSAGAVKPGSPNWLTVVANGSQFELYVNDHKAGIVRDDRIKSGAICLGMEVPGNLNAGFAFEKFIVRAP